MLSVTYSGAKYARVFDDVLPTHYEVRADFATSGGIFPGAEVTYRGVTIGHVKDVSLSPGGIDVQLRIDDSAHVPSDVTAAVHNRSAVGEQYVDLVPDAAGPPYLQQGSVIARSQTSTPLPEDQLIKSLDDLSTSIPVNDLNTVISELGKTFAHNAGPDLQVLLDGTSRLTDAAAHNLPQTVSLLDHSITVLRTQNDQGSDITSFAHSLAQLTGSVRTRDQQLRDLIYRGPGAANELTQLFRGLDPFMPELLANIISVDHVTVDRIGSLKELLEILPMSIAGTTVGVRDKKGPFILADDPAGPPCKVGYIPSSQWRSPLDPTVVPPDYSVGCRSTTLTNRGSQWAPGSGR